MNLDRYFTKAEITSVITTIHIVGYILFIRCVYYSVNYLAFIFSTNERPKDDNTKNSEFPMAVPVPR